MKRKANEMKKTKKKTKPTFVKVEGEQIITNFRWKGLAKDYDAFLRANKGSLLVSPCGNYWMGGSSNLYLAAVARGMALRTDSAPMTKRKVR